MKTLISFLYFLFISIGIWCQLPGESNRFLNESLNQQYISKDEIINDFISYDFSSFWLNNKKATLGFIGNNFQRLSIKIVVVIKNDSSPYKYYVFGKSKVKDNICQFIGEIELIHIRIIDDPDRLFYLKDAKENQDDDVIRRFAYQKYILLGKYQLFEDPKQGGSGVFAGVLKTRFYIDGKKVFYDDLDIESDDFFNNQFVGIWTSYESRSVKKCNWGDRRIPYSDDLDIGVAEFSPNEKYLNNGWLNYHKAYTLQDAEAKKVEDYKWW